MSKSDLVVLQEMASDNKDIRASSTLVETKRVKQGGLVTIGVDTKTVTDLSLTDDYLAVLYVVNKKQFNELKNQ